MISNELIKNFIRGGKMRKYFFIKSAIFIILVVVSLLFTVPFVNAEDLDEPELNTVEEEYVVTTNYYYNDTIHYINSGTYLQNHYDETYLLSTDLEEFLYEIEDQQYLSICVNIELSITRNSSNNSSRGVLAVKNWHTSNGNYADKEFDISTGTHSYFFTFTCNTSHMSNSLCFCYRALNNSIFTSDTWIYNSVEINIYYNNYEYTPGLDRNLA